MPCGTMEISPFEHRMESKSRGKLEPQFSCPCVLPPLTALLSSFSPQHSKHGSQIPHSPRPPIPTRSRIREHEGPRPGLRGLCTSQGGDLSLHRKSDGVTRLQVPRGQVDLLLSPGPSQACPSDTLPFKEALAGLSVSDSDAEKPGVIQIQLFRGVCG